MSCHKVFLILALAIMTSPIVAIEMINVDANSKIVSGTEKESANKNVVVPGTLYIEPTTLHSLGFQWLIKGDDNRNSKVEVRFRPEGENKWRHGMDFLRTKMKK